MSFNFSRKISGLCYTEEVYNKQGSLVTTAIFDNECRLIPYATKYMRYMRISITGSYNTLKRAGIDLCYFYDYLTIRNLTTDEMSDEVLGEFVKYLTIVKVKPESYNDTSYRRPRFSIERTLYKSVPLISHYNNPTIKFIRPVCNFDAKSILRIFNRTIQFLNYLNCEGLYKGNYKLIRLLKFKDQLGFLRAKGLEPIKHEILPVEDYMVLTNEQIDLISRFATTGYERILYFILEKTGIRIGEALGIKIFQDNWPIKGDIQNDGEMWKVKVVWRDNENFRRTKSHRNRTICLTAEESRTFQLLLERYLNYRRSVLDNMESEWLFINMRGKPLTQNSAYSQFKKCLVKAGLSHNEYLTLHSYRHFFATNLLKNGVPLEFVSKLLGHKSIETTKSIYIHFTDSDMLEIRRKYSKKWRIMIMTKKSMHLTFEEYFNVIKKNGLSRKREKIQHNFYNKIIRKWETPNDWFNSNCNELKVFSYSSKKYWIIWSLIKKEPLPKEFYNDLVLMYANETLQKTLLDYQKIAEAISKMSSSLKNLQSYYATVLRVCTFYGTNEFKNITHDDVLEARRAGIFTCYSDAYRLVNLLYFIGYIDRPAGTELFDGMEVRRAKISDQWSENMKLIIEEFIASMKNSKLTSYEMPLEKMRGLNKFAAWYCSNHNISNLSDLKSLSRLEWINYIQYVNADPKRIKKTKSASLLAFYQFISWLNVKYPSIVNNNLIILKDDFKIFDLNESNDNKAFERREYGERILQYLVNNFVSQNISEIFFKEAIIIAANSGMRISEIKQLAYKGLFWSEDEQCYKIILDYIDKLNQKGRPIYLTKDGFEAIKRLEVLREKLGVLNKRYNERSGKSYIHLFEFRGKNPLESSRFYNFLSKLKIDLKLIEDNGKPVKGGMHAFRHFFAMTVFIESDYNIGVVRYLLGHRNYDMSLKYLEEEKEKRILDIRSKECINELKIAGQGIDTILEILLNNRNSKEYISIITALKHSKKLSDMLHSNTIKKLNLGYCINPCDKANKCFKCNRFLVTQDEAEKLLDLVYEMMELICYKISLFSSFEEAICSNTVKDDIADICILIEELKNLGTNLSDVYSNLKMWGKNV